MNSKNIELRVLSGMESDQGAPQLSAVGNQETSDAPESTSLEPGIEDGGCCDYVQNEAQARGPITVVTENLISLGHWIEWILAALSSYTPSWAPSLSALRLFTSGHRVRLLGRKMDEITQMTNSIKNFSFADCVGGNQGYDRVLLQLFGFLGHGKSSFINTCKYFLEDGKYQNYTDSKRSQGGDTRARITYPLTDTLTLVDNRGCPKMDDYETAEIFAQLANLLPLDMGVEWSRGFGLAERIIEAEADVKSSDFIYPIFVFSVKQGLPNEEMPMIKELLETARDLTEMFPIVVLTHKTSGNLREMKDKFEKIGAERIFALDYLTLQDHIKTRGRHEDVLDFFCEIIKDIEFCLERMGDPERKRKERKKKVLKFIYEREMKEKEEELERQRMREKKLQEEQKKLERELEDKERCTVS